MNALHTIHVSLVLMLLAGMVGAHTTAGATSAPDADSLRPYVDQIRAATERFRDHGAAVAAGYRWMGPDMPNMGEHWIHPRLVMQQPFDPMQPSCLSYVRRGGKRILTGVAYILPVRPGESPPPFPAGGTWHFHSATLNDEAFGHRPHHHAMESDGPMESDGVRLAMMHAWVWKENPDGVFTADNWALSYVRHGLPVPASVDPMAAKALFLSAADGVAYYRNVVDTNASLAPEEARAIRDVLQQARDRVSVALQAAHPGTAPPASTLRAIWHDAWRDVQPQVRAVVWRAIKPILLGPAH
jgi:hypothetical protein